MRKNVHQFLTAPAPGSWFYGLQNDRMTLARLLAFGHGNDVISSTARPHAFEAIRQRGNNYASTSGL